MLMQLLQYITKIISNSFLASCYNKETYLSTYAHFIQPMNNMKMWPTSNNPRIEPPVIRQLPGRPPKSRRKEVYESRKTGLISRRGAVMTCSTCHAKGHNKRGCPTVPRQTTETADQTVEQAQVRTNRGANKTDRTGSCKLWKGQCKFKC
ncbi:uncharacterized protein LOC132043328 [Lycium ferocissimum]|uniref:uncharacterized protein LOC132043328 n=1 Tax=Lycium ferocissimum TaxID=112874 RepID=UPI00281586FB|nr:uncharacterized protein LOC132043328 [Lycium ferocissimum]